MVGPSDAGSSFFIPGPGAGLNEEEIRAAWDRHDTATVNEAARLADTGYPEVQSDTTGRSL